MIRFALIAASTLGFFLTAALGNLMVPLLRAFQGRWDEPKARQAPGHAFQIIIHDNSLAERFVDA